MKIKLGISGRLIGVIEVSVVLVMIFSLISTYVILIQVFQQQTFSKLDAVASLKRNRIDDYLEEVFAEIEYFVNRPTVREYLLPYLADGDLDSKQVFNDRVAELLKRRKIFSDLMVMNKDGLVVYSSKVADEGKIRSTEAYFVNSLEKTYLQEYFFDSGSNATVMIVGTPVKGDDGEIFGVLAAVIDVTTIGDLMMINSGLGSTGESFLVNSYNMVATDLKKESGAVMKKTLFLPQIESCLDGNDGQFDRLDYVGDHVLGVSRWIPSLSSCMITKIDYAEAVAPIRGVVVILLGVLVTGGLLLAVFGYFMGKIVVVPIKKLHEAMRRVKEGSLDTESDVKSNDEIGEMSVTFNEMTKELRASYTDLEEKVAQKTKLLNEELEEAERMNRLMVGRELTMIELKKKLKKR